MKKQLLGSLLAAGLVLFLSQCKKADDPIDQDENELITTVKLTFLEEGTTTETTFVWSDLDGEGGNAPTKFDEIKLKANSKYTMAVEVLDESKNPIEDITEEIEEKAEEHLFVFTPNPTGLLTYQYMDLDARNFPIGLIGKVTTTAAGTGKLNVRLRHQPPVNGNPVKNGTVAPGSDDVNLDFVLKVQ